MRSFLFPTPKVLPMQNGRCCYLTGVPPGAPVSIDDAPLTDQRKIMTCDPKHAAAARGAMQIGNKYRTPAAGHVRTDGKRITVTINTDDLDRHGTVIEPAGAELGHYRRNPIVLASHSLAKVLGTSDVRLKDGRLVAEMTRWSESAVAKKWRADIEAGIVRAASVGFRVLDKQKKRRPDGSTYWRITRWQLIEWSWVAVPSNPHAVARSIQPLSLRDDGSKRFPKDVPIQFTDEQFERLLNGDVGKTAGSAGGTGGARPREVVTLEGAEALRAMHGGVPELPEVHHPDPSARYDLPEVTHEARWKRAFRNVTGRHVTDEPPKRRGAGFTFGDRSR